MTKLKRPIVIIDEEKCNGCGLCITACVEGALRLVDGKARLVSESYCDGLGVCLGECPQGAITVEEREVAAFDEAAVAAYQAKAGQAEEKHSGYAGCPGTLARTIQTGCPGAQARSLDAAPAGPETGELPSMLRNWPVQLHLMPLTAPYLQDADLAVTADCVPFAYANYHQKFVQGKVVAIGCPKLDDAQHYADKMSAMFARNQIRSVHVIYMEVPCCGGLVRVVETALAAAGKDIPVKLTRISVDGEILEEQEIRPKTAAS